MSSSPSRAHNESDQATTVPGLNTIFDRAPPATPPTTPLTPGMKLGQYELLAPVGTGGMASVWAARRHGERGFQARVAIKTILPHLARTAEFETLFLREARFASMIRHPNVCQVHDLGEDRGILFMALEWIDGESLGALLRARPCGGPLPWPLAVRIIADICSGLHAAHGTVDGHGRHLEMLHRDVCPQNILVAESGIVRLADFGIAKAALSTSAMTAAGFLRGKLPYCARPNA